MKISLKNIIESSTREDLYQNIKSAVIDNKEFEKEVIKYISKKYFSGDNNSIQKGLYLLKELTPNIEHLDLSETPISELDVSAFIKLKELLLNQCYLLKDVVGLEYLDNLELISLKHATSLQALGERIKKKGLSTQSETLIIGLRDYAGLVIDSNPELGYNVPNQLDQWCDSMDNWFSIKIDDKDECWGKYIFLLIDEEDFHNGIFEVQNVTSTWKAGKGTPEEMKKALSGSISKEAMDLELKYNCPTEEDAVILLYMSTWEEGPKGYEYATNWQATYSLTINKEEYDEDEW